MALLDALLNIGSHFSPRDLPAVVTLQQNGTVIHGTQGCIDSGKQQEMFMSAVERQKLEDVLFLTAGICTPRVKFTFLTPLQKTAYAYWRDTTDLEFPGAKPIEIEILRELRRRGTRD